MNRIEALKLSIRALQYMITHYPLKTEHYYNEDSPQYRSALELCSQLAQAEKLIKKEIETYTVYPSSTHKRQVIQ